MTTKKIPEITLEVTSGTFKICTEEVACNVTVIGLPDAPAAGTVEVAAEPALMPAVEESVPVPDVMGSILEDAAKPAPEELVQLPKDDYFEVLAGEFAQELGNIADYAYSNITGSPSPEAEATQKLLAARSSVQKVASKAERRATDLAAGIGKLQSKIVDLRFSLTFLKNHALFKPLEGEGEGDLSISMSIDDQTKILTKITAAFNTAQALSDAVSELKKTVGSADELAEGSVAPAMQLLDNLQEELLKSAVTFGSQVKQKISDPEITVEQSKEIARQEIESRAEELEEDMPDEEPGAVVDDEPPLEEELVLGDEPPAEESLAEDMPAEEELMLGDEPEESEVSAEAESETAGEAAAAGEEGEMSDEEALKRFQDLGI